MVHDTGATGRIKSHGHTPGRDSPLSVVVQIPWSHSPMRFSVVRCPLWFKSHGHTPRCDSQLSVVRCGSNPMATLPDAILRCPLWFKSHGHTPRCDSQLSVVRCGSNPMVTLPDAILRCPLWFKSHGHTPRRDSGGPPRALRKKTSAQQKAEKLFWKWVPAFKTRGKQALRPVFEIVSKSTAQGTMCDRTNDQERPREVQVEVKLQTQRERPRR